MARMTRMVMMIVRMVTMTMMALPLIYKITIIVSCFLYKLCDYRYPAVFWKTNKAIAFLFSIQLVGNGLQNLMAFSAMSIMYKVTIIDQYIVKVSSLTTFSPGARDWSTKCFAQIRAVPAEHPDLDVALPPLLRHRHRLLLRHLHVRLPEVHGLPHAGEREAGNQAMIHIYDDMSMRI